MKDRRSPNATSIVNSQDRYHSRSKLLVNMDESN